MLLECFYMLEDFQGLVALTDVLPEGDALLLTLGEKLQSVGLCSEAVVAYLKVGVNLN
jgi:WD repeat-containing protein 35